MKSKLHFIFYVLIIMNLSLCNAAPVASWDFEEGFGQTAANNESAYRNITLTKGASGSLASDAEWSADGISGKCLRFVNGQTGLEADRDFLIAGSDIDLSPLQLQTFTIDVWVKLTSIPPAAFNEECPYYIIDMSDNYSNVMHNYWLRIGRNNDRTARLNLGWYYGNNTGYKAFTHPRDIEAGKWYRLVVCHDANSLTDNTKMWVDDELYVANTTSHPEINQASAALVIGAQKVTTKRNRSFDGYIDSLRIYNYAINDLSELAFENCTYPGTQKLAMDFDGDCSIDLTDFSMFADNWMQCSDPDNQFCSDNILTLPNTNTWRQNWKSLNTFPIGAWAYWHRYAASASQLATYSAANLTMTVAPLTAYDNTVACGIEVLLSKWDEYHNNIPRLDYYTKYLTPSDKSVAGYLLYDEPHTADFATLAPAVEYVKAKDVRGAIPIINLLPIYSGVFTSTEQYEAYVDSFIAEVKPLILCYDNYPLLADNTDRTDFYLNMEIIRSKALANNMDFMGYALVAPHTTTSGYEYRRASESDLRWQVYSLIAYGAKGLFYYNYHKYDPASTTFGDGFVDADDNPTSSYYTAKDINGELINLADVLLSLSSKSVRHTADNLPSGATAYSNGSISGFSLVSGTNFLISEFKNIDDTLDNDVYIMLLNKRHNASADSVSLKASISFSVSPSYQYVYKYNPADGALQQLSGAGTYTIEVNGGQGVLLRLSSDNEI